MKSHSIASKSILLATGTLVAVLSISASGCSKKGAKGPEAASFDAWTAISPDSDVVGHANVAKVYPLVKEFVDKDKSMPAAQKDLFLGCGDAVADSHVTFGFDEETEALAVVVENVTLSQLTACIEKAKPAMAEAKTDVKVEGNVITLTDASSQEEPFHLVFVNSNTLVFAAADNKPFTVDATLALATRPASAGFTGSSNFAQLSRGMDKGKALWVSTTTKQLSEAAAGLQVTLKHVWGTLDLNADKSLEANIVALSDAEGPAKMKAAIEPQLAMISGFMTVKLDAAGEELKANVKVTEDQLKALQSMSGM